MIPFNYHHLYYFYVIAQEGSVSKAAGILRLAQPTLSTQLKQFENFLNVRLFVRENKRLALTEEGHQVLSYAKTIFDIGQELKDRMVDLSHKGRLKIQIGITTFVPKAIVDVLLDYILREEPSAYIQLEKNTMKTLVQNLDDHLLDLVLTDSPFETSLNDGIHNKFIGKIPIVFCAHPKLAKHIKKFPEDLNGQPLLLPTAPKHIFHALKEYFYQHHIHPEIVGEIEDLETVRRLALRGYGIAPINLLTVKNAPSRHRLTILNPAGQHSLYESVYLITKRRKSPHPLTQRILKSFYLKNYLNI